MKIISVEDVILFHEKIIQATGGLDGVRDRGVIDSALNRAQQTFDGKDLYDGVEKKIAVTCYSLVKNHGFVDGNKRIGVAVMLLLLRLNQIKVEYSQAELVELGLQSAAGEITEEVIELWIVRHRVE
jgi:death-on-curing protein